MCNTSVRLVETGVDGIAGPYATLSYCWGGNLGLRLTESMLKGLKSRIEVSELPKTVQDAIQVTRQLNIRYIWVDFLCIIQDSLSDWLKESAFMGDIYRNCLLSIAALGASNSNQGPFAERDPLVYKPCWMCKSVNGEDFYIRSSRGGNFLDKWFKNAALHKRGWVMQERLLSPRTLNFGISVIWECCEVLLSECSAGQVPVWRNLLWMANIKAPFHDLALRDVVSSVSMDSWNPQLIGLWLEYIIGPYSAARVTIKSDRLIAIHGVIHILCERTGWKNIYGLWEPFLLDQLLWRASFEDPRPRITNGAPTWSWGSIETAVCYPLGLLSFSKGTVVATIGGVQKILQAKTNNYQQSKTGVRIRGVLHNLEISQDGCLYICHVGVIGSPIAPDKYSTFDRDTSAMKPGPYLFLPIAAEHSHENYTAEFRIRIYGIAISKSATIPEAYERIGFVQHELLSGDVGPWWGEHFCSAIGTKIRDFLGDVATTRN